MVIINKNKPKQANVRKIEILLRKIKNKNKKI